MAYNERDSYIELEEINLASITFYTIKSCMDYEKFLNLFESETNEFAKFGVSDEDYEEIASLVKENRKRIQEKADSLKSKSKQYTKK